MKRLEALEELSELSSTQWGLITARQAKELGVGGYDLTRLAEGGFLERLRQGVYAVTSAPLNQAQEVRAEWLALSPEKRAGDRLGDLADAVVSHRAAAALHGIGDLNPGGVDFTVPVRRQSRQPGVRFHRGTVPSADRTDLEGLPVTTVLRTLEDLVREGHDGGHLLDMVADALTGRMVVLGEVVERLAPHAPAFGVPAGDTEQLGAAFLAAAPSANPLTQAGESFAAHLMKDALAPIWRNSGVSNVFARAITEATKSMWRPEWGATMAFDAMRPTISASWMAETAPPVVFPPGALPKLRGNSVPRLDDAPALPWRSEDSRKSTSTDEESATGNQSMTKEQDAEEAASKPHVDQDTTDQTGTDRRHRSR